MTLHDLFEEWDNITYQRKIDALKAVIVELDMYCCEDDDLVKTMLEMPKDLESDDYFGTEGLKF